MRRGVLGALAMSTLLAVVVARAACEPSGAAQLPAYPSAGLPPAGGSASLPPASRFAGQPPAGKPVEFVEVAIEHPVVAGDSLSSLGARYGIAYRLIAEANGLAADAHLKTGERLFVRSRHLVPLGHDVSDGIVVNVPQRMAFLFEGGRLAGAWPVTVGRRNWQTPIGPFVVLNRQQDKTWYVPRSIQQEMRREGRPVLTQVPPGPANPLGRHWIGLSLPGIGIHGTNAPASIYGFRSHGCIRMHPDDVAELFARVVTGARGEILYRPLLLARDAAGEIWFEANPDAYRRGGDRLAAVERMADVQGIASAAIDWAQVARMIEQRDGQAQPVGTAGYLKGAR
ncbi:MAG: L,D-transpeptidase family protein [Burkholderiaceae bacterium]